MKVWLLDNGSIVIEHTQLMWNIPGPPVRLPVYSALVEYDDGLILFDTGIDLDHMNPCFRSSCPSRRRSRRSRPSSSSPASGSGDVTTLVNSHLHIDHVGSNQSFEGAGVRDAVHERELTQGATTTRLEFFGYSDKSLGLGQRRHRDRSPATSSWHRASGSTGRPATQLGHL